MRCQSHRNCLLVNCFFTRLNVFGVGSNKSCKVGIEHAKSTRHRNRMREAITHGERTFNLLVKTFQRRRSSNCAWTWHKIRHSDDCGAVIDFVFGL